MKTATEHFATKLQFETDPSDVKAAMSRGDRFVLIDSRGEKAWEQGRIVGAVHVPTADIPSSTIPRDMPVVVYCWGPGCNGSTKAALAFAALGYEVKEMIGGYEYWARAGMGIENVDGLIERAVDELTAPVEGERCDC
ncbi:rhodanese-like domain-containing protein [Actinomycetes bacterium M1A6_2h]